MPKKYRRRVGGAGAEQVQHVMGNTSRRSPENAVIAATATRGRAADRPGARSIGFTSCAPSTMTTIPDVDGEPLDGPHDRSG